MKKIVKNEFSVEVLKEWVSYDPLTGLFTNIKDRGKRSRKNCPVGKVLGTVYRCGYVHIALMGYNYRAHQLAFLYMEGRWSNGIDHKNNNRACNIWTNLIEADHSRNSKNRSEDTRNTSGHVGILPTKHGTWKAQITVNGVFHYLGSHKTKDEAINARKRAAKQYGFKNG